MRIRLSRSSKTDFRTLKPFVQCSQQHVKHADDSMIDRRVLLGSLGSALLLSSSPAQAAPVAESLRSAAPDTTITSKVFFDVGLCPDIYKSDRTLGDKSILCTEPTVVGRIVIGLYGNLLPETTATFKRAVEAGIYNGTIFSRILPGEYIQAGVQGSYRLGNVEIPTDINLAKSSAELLSSRSFKLRHTRPGTVSLALSNTMDEENLRERTAYRNVQFLITTGPGPVPSLDEGNLIFGTVVEGMDVVGAITTTPTFKPSDQLKAYNQLASLFGDDRAQRARKIWGKPLKSVVITSSGVL